MNILILAPAPPNISPSQRFRFEHYLKDASSHNLYFDYRPFYSEDSWKILHKKGLLAKKIFGILGGFVKRFLLLFSLRKYDWIYIHREAAPLGPPVFEWVAARIARKKIIYDFDDAIWIPVASDSNPGVAKIKCTWKVKYICSWSKIVSTGNDYLANFARAYCSDVRVIPTVVDTKHTHCKIKNQAEQPLRIGWTGTFTNLKYLEQINPVIRKLSAQYTFEYVIICDKDPGFSEIEYIYKPWNLKTEIDDLLLFHIGLMPLKESEIELGKCAFKAIQYMSLGIAPVVSPVGANLAVVEDQKTGYLAGDNEEWFTKLEKLMLQNHIRETIGLNARERVEKYFSVMATQEPFFNLFYQRH